MSHDYTKIPDVPYGAPVSITFSHVDVPTLIRRGLDPSTEEGHLRIRDLFLEALGMFEKNLPEPDKCIVDALLASQDIAHVRVAKSVPGKEGTDWATMLLNMYAAWGTKKGYEVTSHDGSRVTIRGPGACRRLRSEAGTHRLVRSSPHDPEGRRMTSFATVTIDDKEGSGVVRSYVLDPDQAVTDHHTEIRHTDAVLAGELDPFLVGNE